MSTQSLQQKELSIAILAGLVCIIAPFASDSYTPSLPAITHAFGTTSNALQLTMTLYFLGASVSQLIYGPLSERYGRRRILLIGLSICILGSLVCVFSGTVMQLIIARFIQGFGAGACNGLFRTILRDSYSGSRLAQIGSYIGIAYPVIFAAAPILGGYIQHNAGWRENFVLTAGVIIGVTLLIYRYLPETHHNRTNASLNIKYILNQYFFLMKQPSFMGYTLLSSCGLSGFICYYTAAPFLLENIVGLSPVVFGWLCVFLAAGMMVAQYVNSRVVMKNGINFMLKWGAIFMLISGVMMLIFASLGYMNVYVIIIPSVIFSLASGFIFSNAMAGAFEKFGHMAGFAGAVYSFFQMILPVLASMVIALFHDNTQLPLASILTVLGILSLIIFYLLSKPQRT